MFFTLSQGSSSCNIITGTIYFNFSILFFFNPGCTRLSRLKIHLHKETKTGLQRLPRFNKRTRHRTFMNLSGKIFHSKNFCSNCNHHKHLSKRKLIERSNQSWLSSISTERMSTSSIVIRCQNS